MSEIESADRGASGSGTVGIRNKNCHSPCQRQKKAVPTQSLLRPVPGEDSRQSEFLKAVFPVMGHAWNEQKFPLVGLCIDPETVHERGRFADMSRRGSRDGTDIAIVISNAR